MFVVILTVSQKAYCLDLTYYNCLVAFIKMTNETQYPTLVDDWMKEFRPQIWDQYHEDQFNLDAQRTEMKSVISKALNSYNTSEPFDINLGERIGPYDFTDEVFDLHPFSKNTSFSISRKHGSYSLPDRFKISFANPDILNGLPMKKEEAKKFLESRKHSYGGGYDEEIAISVKAIPIKANQNHEIVLKIVELSILDPRRKNKVIFQASEQP